MFIEQRKSGLRFHRKFDSRLTVLAIRLILFLGIFLRFIAWNMIAALNRSPRPRTMRRVYTGATLWCLGWGGPSRVRNAAVK